MSKSSLSPNVRHELVKQNFEAYCEELKRTGRSFPSNQHGKVNVSKVAVICGSTRSSFARKGTKLSNMLAKAVEDIGVEPCSDSAKRKLSSKKKGVNHFLAGQDYDERNTNNTTATVIEMRDVIDNLEAEIRQIKSEQEKRNRLIELMLEDGKRRFDWE